MTPTLPTTAAPRTLLEFERTFRTEEECRRFLENLRWPEGFRCACGGQGWAAADGTWKCRVCRARTSVTAGTVFHGTRLPLMVWFRAVWCVTSQRTGVSALGLQHALGLGSYRTAWSMLHAIRRVMALRRRPLRGRIAVGLRCICAGKGCGPGDERRSDIAIAVEEGDTGVSRVRMRRLTLRTGEELHAFLQEVVVPGSTAYADDAETAVLLAEAAYALAPASAARGGSRIQLTLGLAKRWLNGTHQGRYEHAYLEAYLEEFSFRFNRRNVVHPGSLFLRLLQAAVAEEGPPLEIGRSSEVVMPSFS